MQKAIPLSVFALSLSAIISLPEAQTPPQAFSYQALVRDGAGSAVRNRSIDVRVRLHQDSANGAVAYAETFTPTTNNFGNINLSIGRGSVVTGTFAALDWSRAMYVEIGIDAAGGTTYTDLGTTQLLSVPYAMYSARGGIDKSRIYKKYANMITPASFVCQNVVAYCNDANDVLLSGGYSADAVLQVIRNYSVEDVNSVSGWSVRACPSGGAAFFEASADCLRVD